MFSEWRFKVIVHFVDIDGIVDHHCLNLFSWLEVKQTPPPPISENITGHT